MVFLSTSIGTTRHPYTKTTTIKDFELNLITYTKIN